MENNIFDLDVQINKSKGSVEPQVTSLAWQCTAMCRTAINFCSETAGVKCFSNIEAL
ncbi:MULTISPECIES: FDLD family class I lanthipeptide [Paenibacillus]|uniref:Gallidermin/nisin family lantibiotic n=1 Tax=Paenibacillus ottowii TaxID=2315729 RepID=A0ABY3B750_9BACL|nr:MULTISPECIES: FDLD family class I lanthipeptide [Paenibacillus]TQR99570.1 gallidermin/nisin family lantibiotic [Paenibacillus ottowii]